MEQIEERSANLPGSPHPSSRLRSNRLSLNNNRDTPLSPMQALMVGLDGEIISNSPSASSPSKSELINSKTPPPSNNNKGNDNKKKKSKSK